jgi:serine/threonine protein kinase
MIYGKYPYVGMNDMDILKKIKKGRPDYSAFEISRDCRDFLDGCMTADPKKRISWREIYEHPLITKQSGMLYSGILQSSKINVKKNKIFYDKTDENKINEVKAEHDFGEGI